MNVVQQQFVQVGERRVFLRHAGVGPAVVLLHQSPQSSQALLPWIQRLAPHYAVFAPDTPGFGLSDPLPLAQPTIPDLAAALGRLLDALGLQKVLLYGVHTGAVVAARLALDQPQRVAALVCDGLAAFNAQERQALLDGAYLPPFEPSWDGSHLLWLWSRLREQYLFFPWHKPTQSARLSYAMPSPETLMSGVLDVLAAGDDYRKGYRAPFLYEHGAASAARLAVPSGIFYRASDVLAAHASRLPAPPALPANVQAAVLAGDAAELVQRSDALFAHHAHEAAHANSALVVAQAQAASRRVLATAQAELALCVGGDAHGAVKLVIPDIGQPAALPQDIHTGQRVLVLELPGHGASLQWRPQDLSPQALAATVVQALDMMAVPRLRISAWGGSCALGAAVAQRLGARCDGLRWHNPLPLTAPEQALFIRGLPDLTLDALGTPLIAAWHWVRLKSLFWPWLPPDSAAAIAAAAATPRQVHAQVVELLRAGPLHKAMWQAALASDLLALKNALHGKMQVQANEAAELQRLAQVLSDTRKTR